MGSTSERLPSFKGPRDLSLSARGGKKDGASPGSSGDGGKSRPRRVFTPNIPPKRDRGGTVPSGPSRSDHQSSSSGGKDGAGPSSHSGPAASARGRAPRGRGGAQRGGAGRGFNKARGELVQSSSIFSDGVGNPTETARRSSALQYKTGYGSSGRYKSAGEGGSSRMSSMNRSTLKTIIKEKEEDAESDKKIFGEDKLDAEDEEETDPANPNVPVALPLISYVPEFFMEPAILDGSPIPSTTPTPVATEIELSKVKQEVDLDEDEEISKANELKLLASLPLEPSSFAGTFRSAPPDGTLAYFQLPDEIPVLQGSVRTSGDPNEGSKNSAELVRDLDDLPEGIVGKLQILSTGRTRFILGENVFDVDPGRPVGFRQELQAMDVENKTLTNLGPINRKFVITPDITSLFDDSF